MMEFDMICWADGEIRHLIRAHWLFTGLISGFVLWQCVDDIVVHFLALDCSRIAIS